MFERREMNVFLVIMILKFLIRTPQLNAFWSVWDEWLNCKGAKKVNVAACMVSLSTKNVLNVDLNNKPNVTEFPLIFRTVQCCICCFTVETHVGWEHVVGGWRGRQWISSRPPPSPPSSSSPDGRCPVKSLWWHAWTSQSLQPQLVHQLRPQQRRRYVDSVFCILSPWVEETG